MKLHMFEILKSASAILCILGKTLIRLERKKYNEEKPICGH